MTVKIQSVRFDADQKLLDFIEAKVGKMDRFIEGIMAAEVTLRLDKDHEQGNKVALVRLEVSGGELVSERQSKSFEEAIDHCIDALRKQAERFKEKHK